MDGGRLREAAPPDWLVEVVRPNRAAVPWAQMARAVLAICVPLAVGQAIGKPIVGVLPATGGLLSTVADTAGPYRARLRRIASASVFGGATGLLIGTLIHGRGWVAVAALVVVAGVSALLSGVSGTGSVTGLQLLVYASFGTGPLGALRPWWLAPLLFLSGVAWGTSLLLPGWLLAPRAEERRRVAEVYRACARKLRAIGAGEYEYEEERRRVTAALNAAYDALLEARSAASGQDRRRTRLVALLNHTHLITEASTRLAHEGRRPPPQVIAALERLADTIQRGGAAPAVPRPGVDATPGELALYDGLSGAADLVAGRRPYPVSEPGPGEAGARRGLAGQGGQFARLRDLVQGGRLTRVYTIRLMLCIGVGAVVSEALPLQRSYWVVLTVAIVLKPDFGSVLARALQRSVGTVIGAVAGALILAVLPGGPLLLIPAAVFAALLPYGRSRNWGLFSVFLTPLVVLIIDLLIRSGWRLAEARLIDTVIGCAVVVFAGYLPWPGSWYAHLPREFAAAVDDVAGYMRCAVTGGSGDPARRAERSQLRRKTYRSLSDLRTEFQRTLAEPPAVSRRATAWWPAVVALENVMDKVTATAVAIDHGAPPLPGEVSACVEALRRIAIAAAAGHRVPALAGLPAQEQLRPVCEAVQRVHEALAWAHSDRRAPAQAG